MQRPTAMTISTMPYSLREEIVHSLSHGLGLVLSMGGAVALVGAAAARGNAWHVFACSVFALTLMLLYAASTFYHGLSGPAKGILQRLDHAAIYLLIAGTYTPFTLVSLRGPVGWTLFGVIWGLAILGVSLEARSHSLGDRLSLPLYLAMGWLIVTASEPLRSAVEPNGVLLLALGGGAYTIGVVFYCWHSLPYGHAIWHGFVLAGSILHFVAVLGYVIPPAV